MSPILVDTWAWLALADQRDPYHHLASRQHSAFLQARRGYVTTDFILSELISSLFQVLSFGDAKAFADRLFVAFEAGKQDLIHVTPSQFRRAYELRLRYQDKPDISFVDLTSMVVMQEIGITDIFTGDAHFLQVRLGFRLCPDPSARTPAP